MRRSNNKMAFTLVEIMIVVVIVGLLASIAIPAFIRVRESAQGTRFANDIRIYQNSMQTFMLETGDYPEDSSSGELPTGFEEYIRVESWQAGPAIGGVYDVELRDAGGVTSAIGVHRYTVSDAFLTAFDTKFDDGDLSTGSYRKLEAQRYYYVVED